jgi:hypothetical protein
MRNEWDDDKPEEETGVTAEGMVEAVTQDVELIVDKVMDTAGDAVVAVQETLRIRRPTRPRPKKSAKKPAKASKPKARAMKAQPSKAAKTKPRKVAKAKTAKPKPAAKSARPSKGRKSGRKR